MTWCEPSVLNVTDTFVQSPSRFFWNEPLSLRRFPRFTFQKLFHDYLKHVSSDCTLAGLYRCVFIVPSLPRAQLVGFKCVFFVAITCLYRHFADDSQCFPHWIIKMPRRSKALKYLTASSKKEGRKQTNSLAWAMPKVTESPWQQKTAQQRMTCQSHHLAVVRVCDCEM